MKEKVAWWQNSTLIFETNIFVMRFAILDHLYNLENVKKLPKIIFIFFIIFIICLSSRN